MESRRTIDGIGAKNECQTIADCLLIGARLPLTDWKGEAPNRKYEVQIAIPSETIDISRSLLSETSEHASAAEQRAWHFQGLDCGGTSC
jgi:hypothetical protein